MVQDSLDMLYLCSILSPSGPMKDMVSQPLFYNSEKRYNLYTQVYIQVIRRLGAAATYDNHTEVLW